jgi:hypothetical protein
MQVHKTQKDHKKEKEIFFTHQTLPWRPGLVVSSLPATEEIAALGPEIESRQGKGGKLLNKKVTRGRVEQVRPVRKFSLVL